eukprot:1177961-Prorocentrum_minimum.AAC.2
MCVAHSKRRTQLAHPCVLPLPLASPPPEISTFSRNSSSMNALFRCKRRGGPTPTASESDTECERADRVQMRNPVDRAYAQWQRSCSAAAAVRPPFWVAFRNECLATAGGGVRGCEEHTRMVLWSLYAARAAEWAAAAPGRVLFVVLEELQVGSRQSMCYQSVT